MPIDLPQWPPDPRAWLIVGLLALHYLAFLTSTGLPMRRRITRRSATRWARRFWVVSWDRALLLAFGGSVLSALAWAQMVNLPATISIVGVTIFLAGFILRYWSASTGLILGKKGTFS